jgi:transposase-like protein
MGQAVSGIGQAWRRAWEHVVPLFAFPPAIRKMIYTTDEVESLHRSVRKIIKTCGSYPTDEAALKLCFWRSAMPRVGNKGTGVSTLVAEGRARPGRNVRKTV